MLGPPTRRRGDQTGGAEVGHARSAVPPRPHRVLSWQHVLFRITFISHVGAVEIVNTLHGVTGADVSWETPDLDEPKNVADAVNSALQATYRGMLGENAMLDRITAASVVDPAIPGDISVIGSHELGVAGARTVSDDDLPASICGRITWRTPLSGKSFRGRMFCPPVEVDSSFTDDLLSAGGAYALALAAFAQEVVDSNDGTGLDVAGGGGNLEFVVYSPTRRAALHNPFITVINGFTVQRDVSLLKSRRS